MRYPSPEEILLLHYRVVQETGGRHGVVDAGAFVHLSTKPQQRVDGKVAYRTVYEKAAAYLQGFARGHAFTDGNKRTGLIVAARFLHLNGYMLTASSEEAERFTVAVVTKRLSVQAIGDWFRRNTKKR